MSECLITELLNYCQTESHRSHPYKDNQNELQYTSVLSMVHFPVYSNASICACTKCCRQIFWNIQYSEAVYKQDCFWFVCMLKCKDVFSCCMHYLIVHVIRSRFTCACFRCMYTDFMCFMYEQLNTEPTLHC